MKPHLLSRSLLADDRMAMMASHTTATLVTSAAPNATRVR